MSFLNSVISSIGDKDSTTPVQRSIIIPKKPAPSSKPSTSLTSPAPSNSTNGPNTLKRKAEQSDVNQLLKAPNSSTPRPRTPTPSRSKTGSPVQRPGVALPPRPLEPYRGTVRTTTQPTSASASGKSGNVVAAQKSAPVSTPAPAAAPKKGYLAILERAKANLANATPVGQIKHQKTVEKGRLSRRERDRQAAEASAAAKQGAKAIGAPKSATGIRAVASAAASIKSPKPKKRKIVVEYKGTARQVPSAPAYSGTMRAGQVNGHKARGNAHGGRPPKQPSYRYAEDDEDDIEEEEEEEEEEELDDYDSASSDMEAGRDELDEEELISQRVAKKEDEEALREENRLKLEKQRKLDAVRAAAAKKKKIY